MVPEIVVNTPAKLAEELARRFEEEALRKLASTGRFAVGLPGGSVAATFFPRLARTNVEWSRTEFFWADERAVPASDPESNFGLAHALWLGPAGVPGARVHRMEADSADLDRAAAGYADTMVRLLGRPPRLDFLLLGVGPDGHLASLFPGHPLLRERARWVAAVTDSPKPPPRRLTLTLPVLEAADRIAVAALGEGKAGVLAEALGSADSELPVALLVRCARRLTFLLDREAASRLQSVPRSSPRS
jgi:6-phosphogluconolactonase